MSRSFTCDWLREVYRQYTESEPSDFLFNSLFLLSSLDFRRKMYHIQLPIVITHKSPRKKNRTTLELVHLLPNEEERQGHLSHASSKPCTAAHNFVGVSTPSPFPIFRLSLYILRSIFTFLGAFSINRNFIAGKAKMGNTLFPVVQWAKSYQEHQTFLASREKSS